jgi:hypothetical protein
VSTVDTEYGSVLLDERTGHYWQLSRTAGIVLDVIRSGQDTASAVDRITELYAVERVTVERDVAALVERMRELGVLTP